MDKTPRLHVLIVDDHDEMRAMLSRTLTEFGHTTFVAEHGGVALKIAASHPIDLMITDLVMPEKEGIETIMAIRKQYPHIRILAMSGGHQNRNSLPYLELAARLGAHGTLQKPFNISELVAKIDEIIPADFVPASAQGDA